MMNGDDIHEGETHWLESRGRIVRGQCLDKAGSHSIKFAIVGEVTGTVSEIRVTADKVFASDFEAMLECKEQVAKWQVQAEKMERVVCEHKEGA
jgi:hypothetical protein